MHANGNGKVPSGDVGIRPERRLRYVRVCRNEPAAGRTRGVVANDHRIGERRVIERMTAFAPRHRKSSIARSPQRHLAKTQTSYLRTGWRAWSCGDVIWSFHGQSDVVVELTGGARRPGRRGVAFRDSLRTVRVRWLQHRDQHVDEGLQALPIEALTLDGAHDQQAVAECADVVSEQVRGKVVPNRSVLLRPVDQ